MVDTRTRKIIHMVTRLRREASAIELRRGSLEIEGLDSTDILNQHRDMLREVLNLADMETINPLAKTNGQALHQ